MKVSSRETLIKQVCAQMLLEIRDVGEKGGRKENQFTTSKILSIVESA